MRLSISPDNPHGYTRWGFAWEHVRPRMQACLDFGCHDGRFLASLRGKQIERLVGVDVYEEAVERGRRLYGEIEFVTMRIAEELPFANETFSCITMLDVLEHISEQNAVLAEIRRVLRANGTLIVTVPGKHLFSFLDMGNLKFRFPRLHGWYYCRKHSREAYEARYLSNPNGLIGDVSAEKRWHEHFNRGGLGELLSNAGFEVVSFDGTGFFARIIHNTMYAVRPVESLYRALSRLSEMDAHRFESSNLFCVARKDGERRF